ncbi:MAG: hypothetical protein ABI067_01315 [Leifsonia sp.]
MPIPIVKSMTLGMPVVVSEIGGDGALGRLACRSRALHLGRVGGTPAHSAHRRGRPGQAAARLTTANGLRDGYGRNRVTVASVRP